jgi:ribonuclease HI
MELSAVIAALSFLPQGMIVSISTDSKYVQKGITEWIHSWKRNGCENGKKAPGANKSLWMELDSEIDRHRNVEFSWVKAHSGISHNEIADQLATRGVQGSSFFPTRKFDVLPEDSEMEDDKDLKKQLKRTARIMQEDE